MDLKVYIKELLHCHLSVVAYVSYDSQEKSIETSQFRVYLYI